MSEVLVCPSCRAENPPRAKFCMECAAPLAAPRPRPAEERKVVSILFCDLVGFTAMSEAADPEDVEAVLGRYHEVARREIEHHGGVVEKYIGDAVVGVFGVPAVHEDDPERAVRAGLRVLRSLAGITRPDGTPLEARVGVNTGEALVRLDVDPASGRGFLTGDAVNTAARLQAAAAPMGVAAGALTHALTGAVIVYEALPPLTAKGKAEPLEAWRAVEARSRTGLRTAGSTRGPFLGRERELQTLLATAHSTWETGLDHFVLVVGEPGMGKSRLVLEFSRAVEASTELITWRQGRCLAYGDGIAFWALGEVVKEHAGILDSDDVLTVEEKLEQVLPLGTDRAWLRQRLRPLLGLEASQAEREENFAAWTRYLEVMAADRPMVLVLEDLHWAGEAMLGFVEHLLAQDLYVPLLVVVTTRPELLHRHEGALCHLGEGAGRKVRLDVPALTAESARLLMAELLDAPPSPGLERLTRLVGGNPLYAEQYVRLLLDAGHVVRTHAGVRVREDADIPMPATLQAVLAARLDALPGDLKSLLCDAAVIGESFWRGGVAELSGGNPERVEEAMAALAARDLVRPVVARSIEGEPEYLFWHALARDVAYSELPRRRRAHKHAAAARWLEDRSGARRDDFSEIIVHHYETALELAEAAQDAELAASLAAPTARALVRAGERALRLDVAAAERYCARGLVLVSPDAPERARLTQYWAQALWLRRRYSDAAAAYREAIAGYREQGEIRAAAVAMCHLVSVLTWMGEPCFDITRAAVELLEHDGLSAEKAEVLGLYALGLVLTDAEPGDVIEAADGALEICARLGLPDPAMALSCRGGARLQQGDIDGFEDWRRAVEAAREQGLGVERTTIEMNSADFTFVARGAQARVDVLEQGVEFARLHGLESYVLSCREAFVGAWMGSGEWDRALGEAEELIREFDEHEELWDAVVVRALWAVLESLRGASADALPFVPWMLEKGRESEIGWTRAYAVWAAAVVYLSLGRDREGLELLAEAHSSPQSAAVDPDDLPQTARLALAAGDAELARRLVAGIEAHLPATLLPLQEHVMVTVRALLAEADGGLEAAAAGFADAARRWHDFGVPYEEGHALLGRGRCLVALGRAPEAAAPLAAAREIFARLGAKPALAETEEWLARAAGS